MRKGKGVRPEGSPGKHGPPGKRENEKGGEGWWHLNGDVLYAESLRQNSSRNSKCVSAFWRTKRQKLLKGKSIRSLHCSLSLSFPVPFSLSLLSLLDRSSLGPPFFPMSYRMNKERDSWPLLSFMYSRYTAVRYGRLFFHVPWLTLVSTRGSSVLLARRSSRQTDDVEL